MSNRVDEINKKFNMRDTHENNYINRIVVKRVIDDTPDLSYLDQDYTDCTPEENEKYKAQDAQRFEAFDRGDWCMLGIYATADILVPIDKNTSQIVSDVRSGGLWGIESDSEEEHLKETEDEQITDLKSLLSKLNVIVDNNVEIVRESEY